MDENVVFGTDNGIIALALMLYHQQVLEHDGSQELADRAYELYLKYRDMEDSPS